MAAQSGPKEQAFFSEEATRQILTRIANVFNDTDLCDATFVVGEGAEKEEIMAPSQFMAISSTYFKELFYPPREDKTREIPQLQPKIFRKILDYLFRGRVPLSSIEDAWKVKVAGRLFDLKELEELCTKFLKYRIDSKNLVHFLKNTTKYDTPDLKEVVISRFVKDAANGFESEQVLDLSEQELLAIMERKPEVQAKKVIDVLIRWARKIHKAEKKAQEDAKAAEAKEAEVEKKAEAEKVETEKQVEEEKKAEDENKVDAEKKEEDSKDEAPNKETSEKADEEKEKESIEKSTEEESKKEEKSEDDKTKKEEAEKMETDDKPETKEVVPEEEEENFIEPLQHLVKHLTWDHNDADYYLNNIHTKKVLSETNKNVAMAQMLKTFVSLPAPVMQQSPSAAVKMGPKSAQQQQQQRASPQNRNQRGGAQKRPAGECDVVMERISKNPRAAAANSRVKTEDEMIL